jgi:hypothetical protein
VLRDGEPLLRVRRPRRDSEAERCLPDGGAHAGERGMEWRRLNLSSGWRTRYEEKNFRSKTNTSRLPRSGDGRDCWPSSRHLFLANNKGFVLSCAAGAGVASLLGDEWAARLRSRFEQHAVSYIQCSVCFQPAVLFS